MRLTKKSPKEVEKKENPEVKEKAPKYRHYSILGIAIKVTVTLVIAAGLIGGWIYIDKTYTVTNVYVEGNAHYSDEEIIDMVMTGFGGHNSLYLAYKYDNKQIEDVPFVSTMEVEILAPDTVQITVYEKTLAGYVMYLGQCMYFDRDGTVVESSPEKTIGVPEVMGLSFDHVVKYEPLPVEDPNVFTEILDISQNLNKYSLQVDRIFFDKNKSVTLFFGDVRINMGSSAYIDEKFSYLQEILPELSGKKGELSLADYAGDTKTFTFHADK